MSDSGRNGACTIEAAAKEFRLAAREHNGVGGLVLPEKGGYHDTRATDKNFSGLFRLQPRCLSPLGSCQHKMAPRKQRHSKDQQFTTRIRPVSCRPIWTRRSQEFSAKWDPSSRKRLANGKHCRLRLWQVIHPNCSSADMTPWKSSAS